MTMTAVERFFKANVLPPNGSIYREIQREIDYAREGKPVSGFLAALGLFSYTEYLGKILLQNEGSYTRQFKAFFRSMGEEYATLLDSREIDVYRMFRSGLVVSYLSQECEITVLAANGSAGISVRPDGKYNINVEVYFQDFITACQQLYEELREEDDVYLP